MGDERAKPRRCKLGLLPLVLLLSGCAGTAPGPSPTSAATQMPAATTEPATASPLALPSPAASGSPAAAGFEAVEDNSIAN